MLRRPTPATDQRVKEVSPLVHHAHQSARPSALAGIASSFRIIAGHGDILTVTSNHTTPDGWSQFDSAG